jgi:hypothetical protein
MTALNIVGVDPHRKTFTATVLDARGGELGHAHFPNTRQGHNAGLAWAARLGPADRWGVEGASGLGRHLAEFLVTAGCDVRDVPAHKTSVRGRGRHEGKTDRLDSHRVAAETQTNLRLARAFKQAAPAAPDSVRDRIALWHNARTSLTKVRVQLLGELDALVHDLPEDLRSQLRPAKTVRARVNSLRRLDTSGVTDPTVALRLWLIERRVAMLRDVLEQDRRPPPSSPSWSTRRTRRSRRWSASHHVPRQRSSSRPATSGASPRPASPGSTAPRRSRPARARARTRPSGTASHAGATGASTRRSTASR